MREMKEVLKDIWNSMREFFERDWTTTEKILVILCCILIGVIKGFCLAPIKKGINFGSNNGNTYHEMEEDYWIEED